MDTYDRWVVGLGMLVLLMCIVLTNYRINTIRDTTTIKQEHELRAQERKYRVYEGKVRIPCPAANGDTSAVYVYTGDIKQVYPSGLGHNTILKMNDGEIHLVYGSVDDVLRSIGRK